MELIREDVFRKQIKKGLFGGYLFFGEEDYLKGITARSVRDTLCPDPTFALFNDVQMDALDYSAGALLDALMPPPMMSEQKLITVKGLQLSAMRQIELDDLFEVLEALKQYDYNVLILSIPAGGMEEGNLPKKPSALFTRLSEYLTPVQFSSISGAKLTSWVGKHFEHHGVSASPEVCAHLIAYSGNSMFTLASETEKLSYYALAHGRSTVTKEDIETVSTPELDADAFALANAILDGRNKDAMHALEVMRFRRIDPIIVLSQITRVICDLCYVKALQQDGIPAGEIGTVLKMNPYQARLYTAGAGQKSEDRIHRALLLCAEADTALKRSPSGYQAIERLIGSL